MVTQITHYYIITAARATLDGFIINNIKDSIASVKKYFIIKRTLFLFKKKFMTADNRRRYLGNKYLKKGMSSALVFVHAVL